MVLWFSYLLPNLCAVRLRRCTLGLIICTESMIFIRLFFFFLISDLHQTYFSLSLGDLAFESYHAKFHGICEKLNICQSRLISRLSSAIVNLCMWLTLSDLPSSYASGLPSSYHPIRSKLLGAWDSPSLDEVSNHLHKGSVSNRSSVAMLPPSCSTEATTISGGYYSSDFSRGGRVLGVGGCGVVGHDSSWPWFWC